jgi:hypothetical protein
MQNQSDDKKKDEVKNKSTAKPDPETLHTPDPQEEMKGPVSSFIQNVKHEAEKTDEVSKEEADKKKEERM